MSRHVAVEFIDPSARNFEGPNPPVEPEAGWNVALNGLPLTLDIENPPVFETGVGSLTRVTLTFFPDSVTFRGAREGPSFDKPREVLQ